MIREDTKTRWCKFKEDEEFGEYFIVGKHGLFLPRLTDDWIQARSRIEAGRDRRLEIAARIRRMFQRDPERTQPTLAFHYEGPLGNRIDEWERQQEQMVLRELYAAGRKALAESWLQPEFDELNAQSHIVPQVLRELPHGHLWLFRERFYVEEESLTADDVRALLLEKEAKKLRRIQRARATVATVARDVELCVSREPIPDDVKIFVWQRDSGMCVRCGSQKNLEFDHIIPLVMGGSNTARNLQLLCETCNREKGGNLV